MKKMTDEAAQKLLGTKDATIADLQDTIACMQDTIRPLKQTIDRLKSDNDFLRHDQEQVRLKAYYLSTVAKTNQDLIQRLLDLNAENKRLEVLVDRLTNRLHSDPGEDDLTAAAKQIREYCISRKNCEGCQFAKPEDREECPFSFTAPQNWPL